MSECDLSQAAGTEQTTAVAGGALGFELYAFRFHFRASDSIYFPPGKSGNVVRGAFGTIFKQIVCIPKCHDSRACELRSGCAYARIFEPVAPSGEGPSGLRDWPRPFAFRAAHLDGRIIEPGRTFHFDVHLFDLKDPAIVYFVLAFAQLAREGIGPRRGRAVLTRVDQMDASGRPGAQIYNGQTFLMNELCPPIRLDLAGVPEPVARVHIRFLTPTELKHGQSLAAKPEFPILIGRIRDRLSTLSALYGPGPLGIDFKGLAERAALVKMAGCNIDYTDVERKSARTGERHPLGGFVGDADYEGDLGEFMPWLRAAPWVGVGRQTVWGKGVIEVAVTG
jgi:hypothetical protein